jgi:hypothetical protein
MVKRNTRSHSACYLLCFLYTIPVDAPPKRALEPDVESCKELSCKRSRVELRPLWQRNKAIYCQLVTRDPKSALVTSLQLLVCQEFNTSLQFVEPLIEHIEELLHAGLYEQSIVQLCQEFIDTMRIISASF